VIWLGFGLIWASWSLGLEGYALIRGYNISPRSLMFSPAAKWTTTIDQDNTTIFPTGAASAAQTTANIQLTVANVTPAGGGTGGPNLSGVGGSGGSPSANVALGKAMAAKYGWTGPQFTALVQLWNMESGWSTHALNSKTRSTGIPQLNPNYHKIPANWASPRVQIAWGLNYIRSTYGNPENALAHENQQGWY
jgi:resuscitation-promoting factor RpfB